MTKPITVPAKSVSTLFWGEAVEVEFERQFRSADGTLFADAAAAPEDAEEVFDIIISTETPVLGPRGYVVLSHAPGAIDMSLAKRGLSFLLEHGGENAPLRVDPELHVGVVDDVRLEDRKLKGRVRFGPSARAQLAKQEFVQKIRRWISVGWQPLSTRAQLLSAGKNGDPDTFLIPRWQVCEASSVSVPADANSRVGRSAGEVEFSVDGHEGDPPAHQEAEQMKRVQGEGGVALEVEDSDPRPAIVVEQRSQGSGGFDVVSHNKRIGEIVSVCVGNGLQARAGEWIEQGLSVEQVKARILDLRSSELLAAGAPAAETLVPLNKKDAERYNIARAIRCAMGLQSSSEFGKPEGLELEVSQEIARKAAGAGIMHRGGLFVPMRLQEELPEAFAKQGRSASMGPAIPTGGAEIVNQNVGEIIDLLRNATMCTALGARLIPGLIGQITWPRLTNDPTVQWMGTNPASGASDSGAKFGFVTSTPKTLIGTVPIPRQLINLSNVDVQSYITNLLVTGHGIALDAGGVSGKGTDREPLGIVNNPDSQTLGMGSGVPSYKLLRQAQGQVLKRNVRGQSLAYMTTPEMAGVLSASPLASTIATGFCWTGKLEDGQLAGYRAVTTNQVPIGANSYMGTANAADHGLILGAWANLIFTLWGALEIVPDQLTLATSGQVRITTFQMADTVNQRPEAFLHHTSARLI